MPPNLQVTKLHKNLKFRQYLLVGFGDLVFWWQKIVFGVDSKLEFETWKSI